MKLKKQAAGLLAALLLLATVPVAQAAGAAVTAGEASAKAGETVSITVSLSDNPGFTNLAVALDYDREKLTLTGLTVPADGLLSAPALTAVSTAWTPPADSGMEREKNYGYLTAASSEKIRADGVLFTASFTVAEGAQGEASVTPVLVGMRDNSALFSVFEARGAEAVAGKVSVKTAAAVLMGDINGDGKVNIVDAARTYAAANGRYTLSDEQKQRVDINGDGKINIVDAARVYAYVNGRFDSLG